MPRDYLNNWTLVVRPLVSVVDRTLQRGYQLEVEVMFEMTPFSKRRTIALNLYRLLASIPNQKYTVLLKTKKKI
jgi:hypothetical protein